MDLSEEDLREIERFRGLCKDESLWKRSEEKRGVVVSKMRENGGPMTTRGIAVIRSPAERVFMVIKDPDRRIDWSSVITDCRIVRRKSALDAIVYLKAKGQLVISPRDFVLRVFGSSDSATGEAVMVGRSQEIEEVSPVPGCVRAKVVNSGFLVEPLSGKDVTKVTYVLQVDFGGKVPMRLANLAMATEPLSLITLRKLLTGSVDP